MPVSIRRGYRRWSSERFQVLAEARGLEEDQGGFSLEEEEGE